MTRARASESVGEVARQRLQNQHLVGAGPARPEDVVRRLGAVQAQDFGGARWAIGQRLRAGTDAGVEQAFARGRILRTHVLRPTWHLVAPADIRWMLELTAPRIKAASAYYIRQAGLDAAMFARSNDALARALEGGHHLTRDELAAVLDRAGIKASGMRLGYLMIVAELDAVMCSGPRRGKQHTYALFDERAPGAKSMPRDQALAELCARYFAGHGPASLPDFAWWSGLTVADARAGVALAGRRLTHAEIEGKPRWFVRPGAPARIELPVCHLLPNYDEYLIAYKDRSAFHDPSRIKGVGTRPDVFANHLVVMNGKLIGGWRRLVERDGVVVETRIVAPLRAGERRALETAARDYGRFLGLPVRLAPAARRRTGTRAAP